MTSSLSKKNQKVLWMLTMDLGFSAAFRGLQYLALGLEMGPVKLACALLV